MHFVREIRLAASEMPAGVGGFISFHIEQSEIFYNVPWRILSRFTRAKHFTTRIFVRITVLVRKKDREKTFSVRFLSVGTIFYESSKLSLRSRRIGGSRLGSNQ